MHENFFTPVDVPELGGARSYASRLFDYAGSGKDQLAWVGRAPPRGPGVALGDDHDVRAAAGHDLHPVRQHARLLGAGGALELVVYAHSLDFGKKAYGNLVELARLQALVADELDLPAGAPRRCT